MTAPQYVAHIAKEGRRTLIEFPDCPGCQTFAEPHEDVLAVAREALEGWLETELQHGEAPAQPKSRRRQRDRLQIRVNPTLAVRLQIRWARQALGLSQAQLAEHVGVSRQQVSLFESQTANLTLGTLANVAKALGMDVEISLRSVDKK